MALSLARTCFPRLLLGFWLFSLPAQAQSLGERCLQELRLNPAETYIVAPRGPLASPSELDFPGRATFTSALPAETSPKNWRLVNAGPDLMKLYQQQEKVAWIFLSQPYATRNGKAAALTFLLKDHGQTHCGYALFHPQGRSWKLERLRKAEGSVNLFKD